MSNSSAISQMDRLPKWIIKLILYPILNSDSTSQHPKGTKNRISNTAVEQFGYFQNGLTFKMDHQTYLPQIGFGFYFSTFQKKNESYQQSRCQIVRLFPKWIDFQNGLSNSYYTPYWIQILLPNIPKERRIASAIQLSNSLAISKMD